MERRDAIAAAGRHGAALFAAALALALTGCGAGQDAETSKMETAISGVDANAGTLSLRDLQIDYGTYSEGGQAPLWVWIANDDNESVILESVTSPDAEAVTFATEVATESPGEGEPAESPDAGQGTETPTAGEATPSPGTHEATESPGPDATVPPATATPSPSPTGTPSPDETASPEGEGETTAAEVVGEREYTIEIPADDYVRLSPTTGSFLLLEGLEEDLEMGSTVELEFTFSNGEVVEIEVPMGNPETSSERSYFGDPHEPAAE